MQLILMLNLEEMKLEINYYIAYLEKTKTNWHIEADTTFLAMASLTFFNSKTHICKLK